MAYAPAYPGGWKNSPDTSTPITAAALQNMESGIGGALPAAGGTLKYMGSNGTITQIAAA